MRFTNEYGDYVMPCHSIQFSFFVRNKGGIQCYFLSWWRYILACVMCMHENMCQNNTTTATVWRFGFVVAYFHCKRANQFSFPHTNTSTLSDVSTSTQTRTYTANMLFVGVFVWCWQIDRGKRVQTQKWLYTTQYVHNLHTPHNWFIKHRENSPSTTSLLYSNTNRLTRVHMHVCIRTRTGIPTLIGFVLSSSVYRLQYHTFLLENSSCCFFSCRLFFSAIFPSHSYSSIL